MQNCAKYYAYFGPLRCEFPRTRNDSYPLNTPKVRKKWKVSSCLVLKVVGWTPSYWVKVTAKIHICFILLF